MFNIPFLKRKKKADAPDSPAQTLPSSGRPPDSAGSSTRLRTWDSNTSPPPSSTVTGGSRDDAPWASPNGFAGDSWGTRASRAFEAASDAEGGAEQTQGGGGDQGRLVGGPRPRTEAPSGTTLTKRKSIIGTVWSSLGGKNKDAKEPATGEPKRKEKAKSAEKDQKDQSSSGDRTRVNSNSTSHRRKHSTPSNAGSASLPLAGREPSKSSDVLALAPAYFDAELHTYIRTLDDSLTPTWTYLVTVHPFPGSVLTDAGFDEGRVQPYTIQRTYKDFVKLDGQLKKQAKKEYGQIKGSPVERQFPILPESSWRATETVARKRQILLNAYVKDLLHLPEKLTRCLFVAEFFGLWGCDANADDGDEDGLGFESGSARAMGRGLAAGGAIGGFGVEEEYLESEPETEESGEDEGEESGEDEEEEPSDGEEEEDEFSESEEESLDDDEEETEDSQSNYTYDSESAYTPSMASHPSSYRDPYHDEAGSDRRRSMLSYGTGNRSFQSRSSGGNLRTRGGGAGYASSAKSAASRTSEKSGYPASNPDPTAAEVDGPAAGSANPSRKPSLHAKPPSVRSVASSRSAGTWLNRSASNGSTLPIGPAASAGSIMGGPLSRHPSERVGAGLERKGSWSAAAMPATVGAAMYVAGGLGGGLQGHGRTASLSSKHSRKSQNHVARAASMRSSGGRGGGSVGGNGGGYDRRSFDGEEVLSVESSVYGTLVGGPAGSVTRQEGAMNGREKTLSGRSAGGRSTGGKSTGGKSTGGKSTGAKSEAGKGSRRKHSTGGDSSRREGGRERDPEAKRDRDPHRSPAPRRGTDTSNDADPRHRSPAPRRGTDTSNDTDPRPRSVVSLAKRSSGGAPSMRSTGAGSSQRHSRISAASGEGRAIASMGSDSSLGRWPAQGQGSGYSDGGGKGGKQETGQWGPPGRGEPAQGWHRQEGQQLGNGKRNPSSDRRGQQLSPRGHGNQGKRLSATSPIRNLANDDEEELTPTRRISTVGVPAVDPRRRSDLYSGGGLSPKERDARRTSRHSADTRRQKESTIPSTPPRQLPDHAARSADGHYELSDSDGEDYETPPPPKTMAPPPPERGFSPPRQPMLQSESNGPMQFSHAPLNGAGSTLMQALRAAPQPQQQANGGAPGRRPLLLFRSTSLEAGKEGGGRPRLVLQLDPERQGGGANSAQGVQSPLSPGQQLGGGRLALPRQIGGVQPGGGVGGAYRFQERLALLREKEAQEQEQCGGEGEDPLTPASEDPTSPNNLMRARTLPTHIQRNSGIPNGAGEM